MADQLWLMTRIREEEVADICLFVSQKHFVIPYAVSVMDILVSNSRVHHNRDCLSMS